MLLVKDTFILGMKLGVLYDSHGVLCDFFSNFFLKSINKTFVKEMV